ncbi:hypothetical protein ACFQ3N_01465 [Virgibacillus byunsanensis]|uniref:Uncharacterized protein n=1 Tax=Virgibacillus byunsanensis TaxID=570945 RepID=A0ABW3LFE8_9BACI
MKKVFTTITLGTLLVAGFLFAQDKQPLDTASDLEPSVLSIGNYEFNA